MRKLTIITAGALAAALAATTANAAPGIATGNVNMRTDDTVHAPRITTIPAGAQVEVHGCPTWCNVTYRGATGWVSSNYIQVGVYQPRQRYYRPAPPPPVYYQPHYRWRWNDDDRDHRRRDHRRHRNRGNDGGFSFEFRL